MPSKLQAIGAALAALASIAACGERRPVAKPAEPAESSAPAASAASSGSATSSELSPALAPLAWWLGDWDAEDGSGSEHWVAAAGAIYGVALQKTGAFEVMIVDDGNGPGAPDGILRFIAMPGGARSVEFRQRTLDRTGAVFANDAHDFPKTIGYGLDGAGLRAVLGDNTEKRIEFRFRRGAARPAPELVAADLAFAADTGQRGVDGWIAAFDPKGWMMQRGGKVEYAEIAGAMRPTLSAGRLDWAPIASGIAGDLGFTVGKATFTGRTPDRGWRSSYVTIWRRQPDGGWKVLFDTGRVVQER